MNKVSVQESAEWLPELLATFRRVAPRWPCPTEKMLLDIRPLHSVDWVCRMKRSIEARHKAEHQKTKKVSKTLAMLEQCVPHAIDLFATYETLGIPQSAELRDKFLVVYKLLPRLRSALEQDTLIRTSWHVPAEVIGLSAMVAWRRAGRITFGTKPTSPLVIFSQEFLARAEGRERYHGTIGAVFARGVVHEAARRTTVNVS